MDLDGNLLVRAVVDPRSLAGLTAGDWDDLLPLARRTGLLARIAAELEEKRLLDCLLEKVRDQLTAARILAAERSRIIRWEVNRIRRALAAVDSPVILLKGAAYTLADLPPARGRLSSDVDIMVPKARITDVERALLDHGWQHAKLDPYDQRYYRTWMHELPPLEHVQRRTIVDVHHTILPESGRLRPPAELLFDQAQPLGTGSRVKVLAPADMVLHSAAHLFQDGDLHESLRDLVDLDDLLRHFGDRPDFWERLVTRAVRLNLQRPLFYAMRYASGLLGTPIPAQAGAAAAIGRPVWPIPAIMDGVVPRVLVGQPRGRQRWGTTAARWLLYVRSHWLRMPPWLLAMHLLRKTVVAPSNHDATVR